MKTHKKIHRAFERSYNKEAEPALIGSILINNKCFKKIRTIINSEAFGSERHQVIYQAFSRLADRGDFIDIITTCDELNRAGHLQKSGGSDYLSDVISSTTTSAGATHYANLINEAKVVRDLLAIRDQIVLDLNAMTPVSEIRSKAINALSQVKTNSDTETEHISGPITQACTEIEKASKIEGAVPGLATGIYDLDLLIGGLCEGELFVIAGRPSMGKSVLANVISGNVAQDGIPVGVISLEMTSTEMAKRHLSRIGKINFADLKTGRLRENEWKDLISAANKGAKLPIYFKKKKNAEIDDIVQVSENLKIRERIGLVILDYIQLVRSKSRRIENREQEVSEISRRLKIMAQDLEIPVIALAQLNRQCENRGDKRPQLSDLRESGAIEQDADIVAFIYRDVMYNSTADEHDAELIIAKARNAPSRTFVKLHFDGQHQTFKNVVKAA